MPPAIAERDRRPSVSRDGQIGPSCCSSSSQDRRRRQLPTVRQHRKPVEQAAGPRRVVAAEYVRFRGHQPAQATQQVGAAVHPDQRIGIRDLHAALEVGNAQDLRALRIDAQGLDGEQPKMRHP